MSTHIDLWDMESGNLIDSWPTLATALSALKSAIRDGSDAWLDYAVLAIGTEDGTPIPLAEGDDLRALVTPDPATSSARSIAAD